MPKMKIPTHYAHCAENELDYDGGSFMDGWETWQKALCITGIVLVGGALLTGAGFGIKALCSRGGAATTTKAGIVAATTTKAGIVGPVNEFAVKNTVGAMYNLNRPDQIIVFNTRTIESTNIMENYFH